MKPITQLYLRAILKIGIPYGIITAISLKVIEGGDFVFWKILVSAIFFGVILTLILVPLHIAELKRMGIKELTHENLSTNQEIELEVNISKEDLIHKLMNDPTTKEMSLVESENLIILKTKLSSISFGEKIQIRFNKLRDGMNHILISSKPKLFFTSFDYGKNKQNVEYLKKMIEKTL